MAVTKLLCGASLLLLASSTAITDANMTEIQATDIAARFCQRIGVSISAQYDAQYPAARRYARQQDTHWQPHWRITFGDKSEVEVVDASSVVSRYYNFELSQRMQEENKPAGIPIAEEDALQRATAVLQASGQTSELLPQKQNFCNLRIHPRPQGIFG